MKKPLWMLVLIGSGTAILTAALGFGLLTLLNSKSPLTSLESLAKVGNQEEERLYPIPWLPTLSPSNRPKRTYGYIDKFGKVIIPPKFDNAFPFINPNRALAYTSDKGFGFIDRSGNFVSERLKIRDILDTIPANELTPVTIDKKIGYTNLEGKIVTKQLFDFGSPMSFIVMNHTDRILMYNSVIYVKLSNLASVKLENKWGFINKNGEVVIPPQFDEVGYFSQGLASVSVKDTYGKSKYGFIDESGKFVISPQFEQASPFIEDLAMVLIGQKAGFIDKSGKFVIPLNHTGIFAIFSNGLTSIEGQGKKAFIDNKGNIKIEFQESEYSPHSRMFTEGMLPVMTKSRSCGYIDTDGKIVIPIQFRECTPFFKDLAAVVKDGKQSYINKSGAIVWQEELPSMNNL